MQAKLVDLYSDYRTQPSYILANLDPAKSSDDDDGFDMQCDAGFVLVSRIMTGNQSCVDESTAKKWINDGVKGLEIEGYDSKDAGNVETNPGTQCKSGHQVVYHIANAEHQCVLNSDAIQMIDQSIAEDHTLVDYIENKDDQRKYLDIIYDVNQKISEIEKEFDAKNKELESKYHALIESQDLLEKEKMHEAIGEYKVGNMTKDEIDVQISKIRKQSSLLKEKILDEATAEFKSLESKKKKSMLDVVRGYEENPDINVDWNSFNPETNTSPVVIEEKTDEQSIQMSAYAGNDKKVHLGNVDVVNSFGHQFDEIRANQVLQIAADIANTDMEEQSFAYIVEITDADDELVQPAKWATGKINPSQTFNVSLSWIPKSVGEYDATLFIGNDIDSVTRAADIKISVNSDGGISDDNYCKNDHALLFKYSDNSPICVASDTASKLIGKGLAFA